MAIATAIAFLAELATFFFPGACILRPGRSDVWFAGGSVASFWHLPCFSTKSFSLMEFHRMPTRFSLGSFKSPLSFFSSDSARTLP